MQVMNNNSRNRFAPLRSEAKQCCVRYGTGPLGLEGICTPKLGGVTLKVNKNY